MGRVVVRVEFLDGAGKAATWVVPVVRDGEFLVLGLDLLVLFENGPNGPNDSSDEEDAADCCAGNDSLWNGLAGDDDLGRRCRRRDRSRRRKVLLVVPGGNVGCPLFGDVHDGFVVFVAGVRKGIHPLCARKSATLMAKSDDETYHLCQDCCSSRRTK